ncbi:MAG: hypothetical protein ACKVT0_00505 [Planctomycetaceae bacterium]
MKKKCETCDKFAVRGEQVLLRMQKTHHGGVEGIGLSHAEAVPSVSDGGPKGEYQ